MGILGLVCPETHQQLETRAGTLALADRRYYPIQDGIPVLLVPERSDNISNQDLRSLPLYNEAFKEMAYYNRVAREAIREVATSAPAADIRRVTEAHGSTFPLPRAAWVDATFDQMSQWDAYCHIAAVEDRDVLQLGGSGSHAVKFLMAGAKSAWVISPMVGELQYAQALAGYFGVASRLHVVASIAEEMPFPDSSIDVIYSGGSLHHTSTQVVFRELRRVLKVGGKFAAVEPWRAPGYGIGTRIIGQNGQRSRTKEVFCRPLTEARMKAFWEVFPEGRLSRHGSLFRYPLIALTKFGVSVPLGNMWQLENLDRTITDRLPVLAKLASSCAVLA